jgi:hypothetical protein
MMVKVMGGLYEIPSSYRADEDGDDPKGLLKAEAMKRR